MIFIDMNNKICHNVILGDLNDEKTQQITNDIKAELMARATLDKRLNARDLQAYSYIMHFEHLGKTQEEIADMLNMSRSNLNKSIEKLTAYKYIQKVSTHGAYSVKRYLINNVNAGITSCDADDIIRLVNTAVIAKKENGEVCEKYKWLSKKDIKKYETKQEYLLEDISILEKILDSDSLEKRKALFKKLNCKLDNMNENTDNLKIEMELNVLKKESDEIDDALYDIRRFRKLLKKFKEDASENPIFLNVLDAELIEKVLEDENMLLVLFLDNLKEDRVTHFCQQHLEDYIQFLCRFTDLSLNEDFFKLYYSTKPVSSFSYDEVMKVVGASHRDVPHKKMEAKINIFKYINKLKEDISKMKEHSIEDENIAVLEERIEESENVLSCDNYSSKDVKYSISDIAIYLLSMGSKERFKDSYIISLDSYLEMFDKELYDAIKICVEDEEQS